MHIHVQLVGAPLSPPRMVVALPVHIKVVAGWVQRGHVSARNRGTGALLCAISGDPPHRLLVAAQRGRPSLPVSKSLVLLPPPSHVAKQTWGWGAGGDAAVGRLVGADARDAAGGAAGVDVQGAVEAGAVAARLGAG